ncbi:hypothetical protein LR48_Vigan05g088300 [Vigna angularis]|uniref:Uncharacterized protein n=1 Tax=Phaseolus angularis TaxID=3914 RepID=A0A0L9UL41_PHAAN|nr:hypothetical protein LR48_Vigan05g088300 [Vigna angularis]
MGLELKDPSFRRHVLVQCLILFDYLKAPGKGDKDLPSESMKEEITSCEERVKKLLELTPPKGSEFLHKIEHILEREKNWVWWKRDGCLPYEKQPIEKKEVPEGSKKRRPRWRLGNKELSQLWKWADQNPTPSTTSRRRRRRRRYPIFSGKFRGFVRLRERDPTLVVAVPASPSGAVTHRRSPPDLACVLFTRRPTLVGISPGI